MVINTTLLIITFVDLFERNFGWFSLRRGLGGDGGVGGGGD